MIMISITITKLGQQTNHFCSHYDFKPNLGIFCLFPFLITEIKNQIDSKSSFPY